jgi:membrane-associated protein
MGRFPKVVKPEHIAKTSEYFARYGGKTIIIARFVPIVRTFAPFVAGMGTMNYQRFMRFNVLGALLWVGLLLPAGYLLAEVRFTLFGHEIVVKEQFGLVVLAIIGISVLPILIELIKSKRRPKVESDGTVG